MKKLYTFDCDGTLVDERGKLRDGVVDLFYNLSISDDKPRFMVCSGNSVPEIKKVIARINAGIKEKYGIDSKINFAIAAGGGSYIENDKGEVLKNDTISKEDFDKIDKIVTSIDPQAVILIRTKFGLFYKKIKTLTNKNFKVAFFKLYMMLKPIGDFKTQSLKVAEFNTQVKNYILNLDIISLDKDCAKRILEEVTNTFGHLKSYPGFAVEVCHGSKLQAVKMINGDDLSNVVYMGDGLNDIEVMKECGLSFALGRKVDVLQSATYALASFNDVNSILFYNADYADISASVIEMAKVLAAKKQAKKELGKAKYYINEIKTKRKNDDQNVKIDEKRI